MINALSTNYNSILLPKYFDKNRKKSSNIGVSKYASVNNFDFLKFLIQKETKKFELILFGLSGLSFESVSYL